MLLMKLINYLFPKIFFKIKSSGGSIGDNTRISYPFKATPIKGNRKERLKIGNNVIIGEGFWISMIDKYGSMNYHPYLEIGNGCNFGRDVSIGCCNKVVIGKKLLTAGRVLISDTIHRYDNVSIPPIEQPLSLGQVEIGDNCFLGVNSCIINCKLGNHVIVGANSVVTKDIPSYSVVAGAPAKIIKRYNFKSKIWERIQS